MNTQWFNIPYKSILRATEKAKQIELLDGSITWVPKGCFKEHGLFIPSTMKLSVTRNGKTRNVQPSTLGKKQQPTVRETAPRSTRRTRALARNGNHPLARQ